MSILMQQRAIISAYQTSVQDYTRQYDAINRKYGNLSLARLAAVIVAVAAFYKYYQSKDLFLLIAGIICVLAFFVLMKLHQRTGVTRMFLRTMKHINEEELAYLSTGALPFAHGDAFQQDNHAYANDLDLFGPRSLYQHLNRTATEMGKTTLAKAMQQTGDTATIAANQQAVAELSKDRAGRHSFYALGKMAQDNAAVYKQLVQWTAQQDAPVNKGLLAVAYILPAILIASLAAYGILRNELYWTIASRLFPINLFIFFLVVKKVKKAMFSADKVNDMLKEYGAMFRQAEAANYSSAKLQNLQQQLNVTGAKASTEIQKLASIFAAMETVQNPFSAVIMNGLYLHHIHQLHKLNTWKQKYAAHVPAWLDVLGELEMLGSLANFYDNNPDFCFPSLNADQVIAFSELGHPLIAAAQRVCNDITFDEHRFVILTGSNMSGKSTFLRTLGVNMVLAGMGSVVCAAKANVQPLRIFVSMRQADSLADSESYFFAEVKRLKFIMDQLDGEVCFVLLDEILRGTNSDDKRSGTIGVIEKIIGKKAIGAIATHDLEVCLTTDQHPDVLINKCFEVEIIDNELSFDYKLRNGICKNKSATFLMKKMEIIG